MWNRRRRKRWPPCRRPLTRIGFVVHHNNEVNMAKEKAASETAEPQPSNNRNAVALVLDDETYATVKRLAEADERSINQWLARHVRKSLAKPSEDTVPHGAFVDLPGRL